MGLHLGPEKCSGECKIVSLHISGHWTGNWKILLQLQPYAKSVTEIVVTDHILSNLIWLRKVEESLYLMKCPPAIQCWSILLFLMLKTNILLLFSVLFLNTVISTYCY